MKKAHKSTAILLAVLLAFSCGTPALAADGSAGRLHRAFALAFDNVMGAMHDDVFAFLQSIVTRRAARRTALGLPQKETPTVEEFLAAEHPYFYPGTDGVVEGGGWRAGYASASIIPPEWRCDADGKSNPDGWCLREAHPRGGYQGKVDKLAGDQMLDVFLLSNRTDGTRNGTDDWMIFVSMDGVGVTRGTCDKIRAAIEQALEPCGVTHEDILWCSVSATHCHDALDTQGMNAGVLLKKILLTPFERYDRSMDETLEKTIIAQAASCAAQALAGAEGGTLSFFETPSVSPHDKIGCGAQIKDTFSCFLFEGVGGEKTILANLGAHAAAFYNNPGKMMLADYPYCIRLAMRDAGYHFLFVQSAQANIGGPSAPDGMYDAQAAAWAQQYAPSEEQWGERYTRKYTDRYYKKGDPDRWVNGGDLVGKLEDGYRFAHLIIDAAQNAPKVAPKIEIRASRALLPLEYGLMALGCVSGLLGEDAVLYPEAETGYGVMAETNYLAIGDDVVILTAPGELYPALLLGTDPHYDGDCLWTGETSWTGEEWGCDTLQTLVREAAGDSGKTVLLFGITNDALGYVYPDNMMPQSFSLSVLLFYRCNSRRDMSENAMLTIGTKAGSSIMDAYIRLIRNGAA